MAMNDPVQVTTNLPSVVQDRFLALSQAQGLNAGELRRTMLTEGVDNHTARFREAYGMTPAEWLALNEPLAIEGSDRANPKQKAHREPAG